MFVFPVARIMMLSVLKHTHNPVKFWFLKNYLSPIFKVLMMGREEGTNGRMDGRTDGKTDGWGEGGGREGGEGRKGEEGKEGREGMEGRRYMDMWI